MSRTDRIELLPEHTDFRASFAAFLDEHVDPNYATWEDDGIVPRWLFERAGELGFLGFEAPEEYGGLGLADFRFNTIINEECYARGYAALNGGFTLQNDVCLPYVLTYGTAEQKERFVPGMVSGHIIGAIAMTEPGAGSDVAGISTRAERDGDVYLVNGSKTFVSNGINADLVITVVRTDPSSKREGLSILLVEGTMPGLARNRLEKIGFHAQDTAELFFADMRVPVENLLGQEGHGFEYLMANLPQERMSVAISSVAAARAAVGWTVEFVKDRTAFGRPIAQFQNTRFELAALDTAVSATEAYIDRCLGDLLAGDLSAEDAARAKLWATEVQADVVDRCLQLFGGYGYMKEYPISRAYVDARVSRIYGGTNEIMKEIIARSLGI
jgi:alkylation response protein AidB-like acyl-CoA dehydrogenase